MTSYLGVTKELTAYEHAGYGGHSVAFLTNPNTGATFHNLWDFCMVSAWFCFRNWNDNISSLRWTGSWGAPL